MTVFTSRPGEESLELNQHYSRCHEGEANLASTALSCTRITLDNMKGMQPWPVQP